MDTPAQYRLTTDYGTLKNDSDTVVITVNIPGGIDDLLYGAIPSGATQQYSNTAVCGVAGSVMEYTINYSMTSHNFVTNRLNVEEVSDLTTRPYSVMVSVIRVGANTVKVLVTVYNYPSGNNLKNLRTVTVTVRTFLPPV